MTQRSSRRPAVAMSLFPFLAVLMCTMGALLVLLVIVMQKARIDGASISAQRLQRGVERDATQESLQSEKDVHEWRRRVLEKQREELRQTLAGRRMTLSHLEDHIRSLERDWRGLAVQAVELQKLGSDHEKDQTATAEELARLQREIDAAGRKLTESKEKARARTQSFAIVPYEGPNGTKRRPIFVECTDEGITLQPEGIVLSVRDFEGDLGPGNPLDAALRATREYLMRLGDTKINGEPYPLLVVRPNGTVAYGVARAAIRAWDDEFGYELVDADMRLEYPPADATLRRELERSITDARQRQAILAAAMPGRFTRSTSSGLVATTNGGFQGAGESAPFQGPAFSARGAAPPAGSFSSTFGPSPAPKGNSIFGTPAALASSAGSTVSNRGSTPSSAVPPAQQSGFPGPGQSPAMSGATSSNTVGSGAVRPGAGGPGAGAQGVLRPGEVRPGEIAQGAAGPGAPASGTTASGAIGSAVGGTKGPRHSAPLGCQPLAATRGENWGLPNRIPSATGFTRSIRVQCLADQLLILPETGDHRDPIVIATTNGISPSIDAFVTAIWKRTETWGLAAEGGFWKPVLRVDVAPDAEDRFQELRTLLDGSGLPVQRK